MTFVAFLDHAAEVQGVSDACIEAALTNAIPLTQWTAKGTSSQSAANSGRSGRFAAALHSSSLALLSVGHIAHLTVSASPLLIPTDCISMSPSNAFVQVLHHAVVCVALATKTVFDPKWWDEERSTCCEATPIVYPDDPDAAELQRAAAAMASSEAASRATGLLLTMACDLLKDLQDVVGIDATAGASDDPRLCSGTPQLLRAWVHLAFFGDVHTAETILSSLLDSTSAAASVTEADALCLMSLVLVLKGQADGAVPLLTRAIAVGSALKDDPAGWKCARGGRVHILALLLRAECKRLLDVENSNRECWLDDLRTAGKLSSDESRQFAGVRLGEADMFWSSPPCVSMSTSPSTMKLRILPRLVHRMFHLYSSGIFIAAANELQAQCDVLVVHSTRPTVDIVERHVAEAGFWYDIMDILSPEKLLSNTTKATDKHCISVHPGSYEPRRILSETYDNMNAAEGDTAWMLRAPKDCDGTLRDIIFRLCDFSCLLERHCGACDADDRFAELLLSAAFSQPTRTTNTFPTKTHACGGGNRDVIAPQPQSARATRHTPSRRDEPLKPGPRKVQYAFNSTYVVPASLLEAAVHGGCASARGLQRRASSLSGGNGTSNSARGTPLAPCKTSVFDRLTSPSSSRRASSSCETPPFCDPTLSKTASSFRERVKSARKS